MSYQVLARKWRPQRFDDVVGQQGVTSTLRNAITNKRVAQAFVFAGPRGVGKTTSARILARALNCVNGPTPDPCGVCDACVEIAEGRDMDVLEIDAATHTQVDKVREVIISGLSIPPVRDRHKIFIIDEVHQLSGHSFNALLKSIEEPPPHVVFMMATTELQKIPETILSRSQVHEFRTISEPAISAQLRKIADAEGLEVTDAALRLVARAADGSMRDALTAFDQVVAFAGTTIAVDDVSTVLGLVGRDLLLDVLTAVADEQAPAAFELAGRAIDAGYDLRLLCRELSRLVRDLMLVAVDKARLKDPEVVPEGERARIEALVGRFSREDLLRAFDLVARTEYELRTASEPRYHLEMALLKWIHLRKLAPLADLIEQLERQGTLAAPPSRPGPAGSVSRVPQPRSAPPDAGPTRAGSGFSRTPQPNAGPVGRASSTFGPVGSAPAPKSATPATTPPTPFRRGGAPAAPQVAEPAETTFVAEPDDDTDEVPPQATGTGDFKAAFLGELRRSKVGFYQMTVAQAHRIDVQADRVVFEFAPVHRMMRDQFEQNRPWLEPLAAKIAGRRMQVLSALIEAPAPALDAAARRGAGSTDESPDDLQAEAAADPGMKTLLELLPVEIREVQKLPKG
jgi:DNA polymerase-3 subunit gamma/tau